MYNQVAQSTQLRDYDVDFADWLKEQLHTRPDLNQARLAEQLGVYASTVSYWLKGRSQPDDGNLAKLAEIFGVDTSLLYQLMGRLDHQHEFSPAMAARIERIETLLASIDDPRVREIVTAKLDSALAETVDLVERIQDLLDKEETSS